MTAASPPKRFKHDGALDVSLPAPTFDLDAWAANYEGKMPTPPTQSLWPWT